MIKGWFESPIMEKPTLHRMWFLRRIKSLEREKFYESFSEDLFSKQEENLKSATLNKWGYLKYDLTPLSNPYKNRKRACSLKNKNKNRRKKISWHLFFLLLLWLRAVN